MRASRGKLRGQGYLGLLQVGIFELCLPSDMCGLMLPKRVFLNARGYGTAIAGKLIPGLGVGKRTVICYGVEFFLQWCFCRCSCR